MEEDPPPFPTGRELTNHDSQSKCRATPRYAFRESCFYPARCNPAAGGFQVINYRLLFSPVAQAGIHAKVWMLIFPQKRPPGTCVRSFSYGPPHPLNTTKRGARQKCRCVCLFQTPLLDKPGQTHIFFVLPIHSGSGDLLQRWVCVTVVGSPQNRVVFPVSLHPVKRVPSTRHAHTHTHTHMNFLGFVSGVVSLPSRTFTHVPCRRFSFTSR